jgi:hypothetical protein
MAGYVTDATSSESIQLMPDTAAGSALKAVFLIYELLIAQSVQHLSTRKLA